MLGAYISDLKTLELQVRTVSYYFRYWSLNQNSLYDRLAIHTCVRTTQPRYSDYVRFSLRNNLFLVMLLYGFVRI
jgi:hypothetical protein